MSNNLMTIDEAAQFLDVSDITVKRFIREKLIPAEDNNGKMMLQRENVERYKKITEQFKR